MYFTALPVNEQGRREGTFAAIWNKRDLAGDYSVHASARSIANGFEDQTQKASTIKSNLGLLPLDVVCGFALT